VFCLVPPTGLTQLTAGMASPELAQSLSDALKAAIDAGANAQSSGQPRSRAGSLQARAMSAVELAPTLPERRDVTPSTAAPSRAEDKAADASKEAPRVSVSDALPAAAAQALPSVFQTGSSSATAAGARPASAIKIKAVPAAPVAVAAAATSTDVKAEEAPKPSKPTSATAPAPSPATAPVPAKTKSEVCWRAALPGIVLE